MLFDLIPILFLLHSVGVQTQAKKSEPSADATDFLGVICPILTDRDLIVWL